jgi:hypothetical protein
MQKIFTLNSNTTKQPNTPFLQLFTDVDEYLTTNVYKNYSTDI